MRARVRTTRMVGAAGVFKPNAAKSPTMENRNPKVQPTASRTPVRSEARTPATAGMTRKAKTRNTKTRNTPAIRTEEVTTIPKVPYEAVEKEVAKSPVPAALGLGEMRPSPVRDAGEVDYDLPYSSQVALRIYNALGQRVKTLLDRQASPGSYRLRWDGRDEQGRRVGSGVYFLSMEAQGKGLRKKVVVVR